MPSASPSSAAASPPPSGLLAYASFWNASLLIFVSYLCCGAPLYVNPFPLNVPEFYIGISSLELPLLFCMNDTTKGASGAP